MPQSRQTRTLAAVYRLRRQVGDVEPVRQRHEQIAERRQRRRDADEARLVASKSEISDEHHDRHVHDVVARQHQPRLGAVQSEAAFQRPNDAGRVRVSNHPEENDAAHVRREQRNAVPPSSTTSATHVGRTHHPWTTVGYVAVATVRLFHTYSYQRRLQVTFDTVLD